MDDLVKMAKKCAKKAQKSKFIGTAIFAGVMLGLFGVLFKPSGQKPQSEAKKQDANLNTTLATHQG